MTITARGVAQYGGTNGTRLKTIYSDGTYGPDLYIVASGESRTVTVTTDTSKTLAKITGNYDMENWVLLDMSVMSVQAEYNRGLPLADSNAAGGVLADSAEETDTQPVRIGPDGRLYTAPGGGVVAQAEEPDDTDVLWIDTDDDDEPEETDTGTDKSLGITGAEVGQTVRITEVDENGVPTAWEAVAEGWAQLKCVAKVTTESNCVGIEITDLNLSANVVSIRIFNTGSATGAGLVLAINGVKCNAFAGTLAGTSTSQACVRAWLFRDGADLYGRAAMFNGGINSYSWTDFWSAFEKIESVYLTSVYNDGDTKYIQAGAIVEIWEGMYPNVQ